MPAMKPRGKDVSQLQQIAPVPIQLQSDNQLSHITNVVVGDYRDVSGENGASYMSWPVLITLDDSPYTGIQIYRRYSEFEKLRQQLLEKFKYTPTVVPELPGKDDFSLERLKRTDRWIEKRRKGLQWFMSNVLLNPRFQQLDVVMQFISG